jgi:hypothetical protein
MVREKGDYSSVIATISGDPHTVNQEKEAYFKNYPAEGYMTMLEHDNISEIDGNQFREVKIWRRASCD